MKGRHNMARFLYRASCSAALLLGAIALAGCPPSFHPANRVDFDGDGFFAPGDIESIAGLTVSELEALELDCNDDDDNIFPGAAELCDGDDNDCDGELSAEEDDADADGFTECGYDPASGEVTTDRDCNDDPTSFGALQAPDLDEICAMAPVEGLLGPGVVDADRPEVGLDDDCSGAPSDGEVDRDQDGHADDCELVDLLDTSLPALGRDCDDGNPNINPSIGQGGTPAEFLEVTCVAGEAFDSDCEPTDVANLIPWYADCDQDDDGDVTQVEDSTVVFLCAGATPSGAGLSCPYNGQNWIEAESKPHTDCDDADPRQEGLDLDGDGYSTCDGDYFPGLVSADDNPDANPGLDEACDGIDNDVDGAIDEGFDQDNDTSFSDPSVSPDGCLAAYGIAGIDCDDLDATLNQNDDDDDGVTTCDPLPDCNDGNPDISTIDLDGDGFSSCDTPPDCDDFDEDLTPVDVDGDGFTSCEGDCVDTLVDDPGTPDFDESDPVDGSIAVFPGNGVQCDGYDDTDCDEIDDPLETDTDADGTNECEGDCDDNNPALNALDFDGDGSTTCEGDCDDGDNSRYPGAAPLCDGVLDNDCNGISDANEANADGDSATICDGDCNDYDAFLDIVDDDSDGASTCEGDCDDSDSTLNIDDVDGDGWESCWSTLTPGDCDDSDASLNWSDVDGDGNPTCTESPVVLPADCDDFDRDLNQLDSDGDGETSCDGDCDDGSASVGTGSSEGGSPNGIDNDCDGTADEFLIDSGDLAVVEMMIGADPTTGDAFAEYVEVYNTTTSLLDLRGWEVEVEDVATGGATTFTFDSGTDAEPVLVPAGGRIALARSGNEFGYGFDIADYYWSAAPFSDIGGTITFSFGGDDIDDVTWTGSGCITNCDNGSTNPIYSGPGYWRTGYAMSLKESFVATAAASFNNNQNNWCQEVDALGPNDHGSPGTAPSSIGDPCD